MQMKFFCEVILYLICKPIIMQYSNKTSHTMHTYQNMYPWTPLTFTWSNSNILLVYMISRGIFGNTIFHNRRFYIVIIMAL